MRASKADWSPDEVLAVYRSKGFTVAAGGKHWKVRHPVHPDLIATVKHSSPLPTGYIEQLLELIDELEHREGGV